MSDQPHPIDVRVGQRVRERRKVLGLTQDRLAQSLDLTFQQVQKYERGVNRMSASKLFEAAQVLQVPVSFFFDGEAPTLRAIERSEGGTDGALSPKETRELLNAYARLPNAKMRRQMLDLMKNMATPVAA